MSRYACTLSDNTNDLKLHHIKLINDNELKENVNELFQKVCEDGQLEVLKILLNDERVSPELNDNYAIRITSKNGYSNVVKLLLEDKRVSPESNNNCAII